MPRQHHTILTLPNSRAAKPFVLYQELANQNLEEERKSLLPFIRRCWHRKDDLFTNAQPVLWCARHSRYILSGGNDSTERHRERLGVRKEKTKDRERERLGRTQDECLPHSPRSRPGFGRWGGGEGQSKGKGWSVHFLSPVSCAKVHSSWHGLCAEGLGTHLYGTEGIKKPERGKPSFLQDVPLGSRKEITFGQLPFL